MLERKQKSADSTFMSNKQAGHNKAFFIRNFSKGEASAPPPAGRKKLDTMKPR